MTDNKRRELALHVVQGLMSHPDMQAQDFFAVINAVLCNAITALVNNNTQRRKILQAFHRDSKRLMEDIIKDESLTLN